LNRTGKTRDRARGWGSLPRLMPWPEIPQMPGPNTPGKDRSSGLGWSRSDEHPSTEGWGTFGSLLWREEGSKPAFYGGGGPTMPGRE